MARGEILISISVLTVIKVLTYERVLDQLVANVSLIWCEESSLHALEEVGQSGNVLDFVHEHLIFYAGLRDRWTFLLTVLNWVDIEWPTYELRLALLSILPI
jgi:hypothetical protein